MFTWTPNRNLNFIKNNSNLRHCNQERWHHKNLIFCSYTCWVEDSCETFVFFLPYLLYIVKNRTGEKHKSIITDSMNKNITQLVSQHSLPVLHLHLKDELLLFSFDSYSVVAVGIRTDWLKGTSNGAGKTGKIKLYITP